MRLPTASNLHCADLCPASAVLPRVRQESPAAARGTAIHAFLAAAAKDGRDEALAHVPEEHRATCEAIDLDVLPAGGTYAAEVALAYHVETGIGRELGRNLGRSYPPTDAREMAGTADVLALTADGEAAVILDFKSGHRRVAAAQVNRQLQMLALAAARAYGRSRAVVGLVYLLEDGGAWFDRAEFDAFDLDAIALDLHGIADRVEAAARAVAEGRQPDTATGDHCRYCPSYVHCPAQTALVRQMAADPGTLAVEVHAMLNEHNAAAAYARVKAVEAVLKHVREALYAYAQEHPIPLDNGLVLGSVETRREYVDGKVARDVLGRLYGAPVADAACEWSASKTSIRDALRGVAKNMGLKLAAVEREALAAIGEAGGITPKVSRTVKELPAHALGDGKEAA